MSNIEFTNYDNFLRDIENIANEYPYLAEKRLKKIGNKFRKILKEKSPDSGHKNKYKLNKSWKGKVEGITGKDLEYQIWSTSPHFHLVDRGHIQTDRRGNPKRFIPGKHFLEASAQEVDADVIPKELDSFFHELQRHWDK